jgi:hypothetical protein
MRRPHRLTPSELEILRAGQADPNIITDYFFRSPGSESGWKFDENFDPEGIWQKTVHHATQTDIICVGGFGSGKTAGIAMSACVWAMTTPWFKFLNVAPKAWQAKQMYEYILLTAAGTPFEQLIWEKPRRPFPKIILKFQVGETIYESSLEFMSADRDATGILSWEGDWINIEEAGLLDNLEEIVTALGSRLRGSVRGRSRLGRMSMISNSWDNTYLWYYFDQAATDPEHYLSIIIATRHNKNITPEQLSKMTRRIPEEERDQFLEGSRPEGRGKFFSKHSIYACEDKISTEFIEKKVEEGAVGYSLDKLYGAGVIGFTTPAREGGIYVILGDPGTGAVPNRNAPVIMVWDVPLDFPRRSARLVALWWGNGNGAITPFIDRLLEFRKMYKPVVIAIDSTGTQRNMAEMINVQYLSMPEHEKDFPTVGKISGLDFSGTKKAGYLVVARMFIESGLLSWPKSVVGIRSQLTNYDPARDKNIAQDLVATIAMSAFLIRIYFNVDLTEIAYREDQVPDMELSWEKRYPRSTRERRSAARAEE